MTADNLASALAAVQAQLPHIQKTKTANTGSYSYKYADLSDIASAIHPLLGAAGLAFVARPTLDADGRFGLAYALHHSSGESVDGFYPLPDPTKAKPQEIGSAITYARRYCLTSVTGIAADEDDDGQTASGTTAKKAERLKKHGPPADDPWQAASPEDVPPPKPDSRKTEEPWFTEWLARVIEVGDVSQLAPLREEAQAKYREGKVTKADAEQVAEALRSQTDLLERAAAEGGWPDAKKVPA